MPKKKEKGTKIFGSKLDSSKAVIPDHLEQWLTELEKKGGFETEGIFRISGSLASVKKLKELVEENDKVDFKEYTVHDVAGLTKLYFRELQEPLFTFDLYAIFIAAGAAGDKAEINKALDLLPIGNRAVLQRLLSFLDKIVKLSKINKMTPENLATCLVPNLLRPKTETMESTISDYPFQIGIFTAIIEHYEYFFKKEIDEERKKRDAIRERALNYKKMMEEKYSGPAKKEDEPSADESTPAREARPPLKREETQEDLAFKRNMTLKYKTLSKNTIKRLKDHEKEVTSAMDFQAILEDQCQKIQSGDASMVDIINLLQVPEKRSLPPAREPPAPPVRKDYSTVPNPSFRRSLDPEKAFSTDRNMNDEFDHDGGRSRSWTTLTSEVNPNDIKELLRTLPPLPTLEELDEKQFLSNDAPSNSTNTSPPLNLAPDNSATSSPKPPRPARTKGSFLRN
eukprot:Phypoly_transcript_07369.p1 GENE.Phypoly_transcript_07369~~Phypoly_transcript_07369.p1  ORF type:complete len:454 (+),score=92.18 Phypoly_transcript_07369:223-1584(+)